MRAHFRSKAGVVYPWTHHLAQARAAVELEAQRAQLQGAADAATGRQAEVEAQNKLLHEQLQRMTAGQASGDVPSPGKICGKWRGAVRMRLSSLAAP